MTGSAGATAGRTLLIATTNPGKVREIAGILHGLAVTLLTLDDRPGIPEPEETGATFGENARLKALYYAHATGLLSVADDSGLEIAALDDAPGVHSARWHGSHYPTKFLKIQELLLAASRKAGVPIGARGGTGGDARFVCHIALAHKGRILYEAEGIVRGEILSTPRGDQGFGYDPIFFYPPLGRTLAELGPADKSAVSHRGKAFEALRAHLLAHCDLARDSSTDQRA